MSGDKTRKDGASIDWDRLIAAAREVRENAYAPYSQFQVGAALLTDSGSIFTGCNVENRSYGITICAERTAVVTANAAGERRFRALVVLADSDPVVRPCGLCLDTLAEFSRALPILAVSGPRRELLDLADLLPEPFRFARSDLPRNGAVPDAG